jgi:hypothetical protein
MPLAWTVNVKVDKPSDVRTNFEDHSSASTPMHSTYGSANMPIRNPESFVNMDLKSAPA